MTASSDPSAAAPPRTVLVVDDDQAIRGLVGTTLELEGWEVWTANDGQEAIDLLLDRAPQLVVLDLMMPRVAGFEVLQAMQAHPVLADVPCIVCTARDSQLEQEVGESLGVRRWLVKPIDPDVLAATAEELVPA